MAENKKKKVAVFTLSISHGGGERIASVLINKWHTNYDLEVFLLNPTITYPIPDDTNITVLGNFKTKGSSNILSLILSPYYAYKFKRICKRKKIESVIGILPRANWICVLAKMLGSKTKTIIYEVTTPTRFYNAKTMAGKLALFLVIKLYPKADVMLANSVGICDDLTNNLQIPNPICIYNPMDMDFYKQQVKEAAPQLVDKDCFTFITLSRFNYPKDQETILRAIAQMKNKNFKWISIGQGDNFDDCKLLAEKLELDDRVQFMGYVENPFPQMMEADCFVFSSLLEGFPNALIESLICNLPIISSDCVSGPREVIASATTYTNELVEDGNYHEGEVGILFKPQDVTALAKAMDAVIDNPSLLDQFKNNIPSVLTKFEPNITIHQIEDIIEN